MRLHILAVIGIASIVLTMAGAQQQATGSIHGMVLSATTNEPLGGVAVSAYEGDVVDNPEQTAITDDRGTFALTNLRNGAYFLRFQRDGYDVEFLGERRIGGQLLVDKLTVTPAGATSVLMRLSPTGAILGRVEDTHGKALADTPVRLLRREYWSDGDEHLEPAGDGTMTDTRGEYRLGDVSPGRYIVSAGGVMKRNSAPSASSSYGVVYYPDKASSNAAANIELRAGTEISGINFTIAETRLYHVRGRVVDEDTGRSPAYATVLLDFPDLMSPFSPIFGDPGERLETQTGTFDFLLPSGEHAIGVRISGSPCGTLLGFFVADGPPVLGAGGSIPVVVANTDIDDVVLPIRKTVCLLGSVSSDDGKSPVGWARFYLRTSDNRIRNYVSVRDNGRFEVDGLLPGEYRLFDVQVPEGSYLQEARLGTIDILNRTFTVTRSTAAKLELVLSSKVGQIQGTVTGGDSKPKAEATVVLVPEKTRNRIDLYQVVATDDRGRFTLSSVAPGDYKAFAWESIEEYSWLDPEVLRRYEQQGKPIRIKDSSSETLNLSVIAADGSKR